MNEVVNSERTSAHNIGIIPFARAKAARAKVACANALVTFCVVGTNYWNVSCTSVQCTCLVQVSIVRAKVARHLPMLAGSVSQCWTCNTRAGRYIVSEPPAHQTPTLSWLAGWLVGWEGGRVGW